MDTLARCLDGFTIVEGAVRSRRSFDLVATSQSDPIIRVLSYCADEPEGQRWSCTAFSGYRGLAVGGARRPCEQLVGVDSQGQVLRLARGVRAHEQPIGAALGVRRVRTLPDGFLYVSLGQGGLVRRDGDDRWVPLGTAPAAGAFEDFDAFPSGEIYAVGPEAGVWRFDEGAWWRVEFADGAQPCATACGLDGFVYVACADGSVFKGRGHHWRKIRRAGHGPLRELVWFDDRVYGCDGCRLWQIVDSDVREVPTDAWLRGCTRSLRGGDGVLLLAGPRGAALLEETRWVDLFALPE